MKEGKYRVMLIKAENLEKKQVLNEEEKIQLALMKGQIAQYEKIHFPL